MYKVKNPFHDKYNPERIFYLGDYVTVEDKDRLKDLLERELLIPTNDKVSDFQKLDADKQELTVKEIKSLLDEKGIEYDKKSSKDELLKLLEGVE